MSSQVALTEIEVQATFRARRRPSGLTITGAVIICVFVLAGLFAPIVAPYDPREPVGRSLQPPSTTHLFGTNDIGQDIFSELVWGTRRSMAIAVGSSLLVVFIGVLIGAGAALAGGVTEMVIMRMVDVFLAMPILPLVILIVALTGPSMLVMILTFGLFGWPLIARIVRAQSLTLRKRGFVGGARGFGGGWLYVVRRHLAPALGPIIATALTSTAATIILVESGLAFLGLGDPGGVSWGMVLNRALDQPGLFLSNVWTWWVLPAGLTVTLCVLGFTFLAIGMDPRFNPRDPNLK